MMLRSDTVTDDRVYLSAARQAALIRIKQLSPVEMMRAYLERIDRLDGRLRAYITVTRETALAAAREAEHAVMAGGPLGPLHGVAFAVKDQFATRGVRTTAGSRLLADNVPGEDATVVARLIAAGGILLGKLNLTEFALGGTIHYPFGQPRNPWNTEHDTGGSSAGSGAAVAAALCAVSLGEDTGGSVRSPASWCGVAGHRPTWGLVSRHGCIPLAWSLDAPGPLGRTVEDCALVLQVIAGHDPHDALTTRRPTPDYRAALTGDIRGLRVGVISELTTGPETDPEMRDGVLAATRVLADLGARVDDVSLPLIPRAGAAFMAICDSEGAARHLQTLRTRAGEYDEGTRRRLLAAALLPAGLVQKAQQARALIRAQIVEALRRHDVLVAPTSPRPAPTIANYTAPITSTAQAVTHFFTRRSFPTPASLAGVPAMAVPCGFSSRGLPLSLQILGRRFDDATVLRVGDAYERTTEWHRRRPEWGA
ncbi:MAG: amidase [Candidatus Rokuibacteriota bacterium]|nr:MAG: amidase [Candidatus Rokubacteria bacterium]